MDGTSPTQFDYTQNGKLCHSGLAIQLRTHAAQCVAVLKFKFNDKEIQSPYQCDPTDFSKKCRLYYVSNEVDTDSNLYVETPCSCSLDGDTGFCGSMVGTKPYEDFLQTYRQLLSNNKCHTLDRFNLKSYSDKCAAMPPE
jgi:hypothetical protein